MLKMKLEDFADNADESPREVLIRLRAVKVGFNLAGQRRRCRPISTPFAERIHGQAEDAKARKEKSNASNQR